jgi:putative OPT family oligopeptide transporter
MSTFNQDARLPEFTLIPLVMGVVLGIIFGASSLYLALKVGMTVSASIPVAVLSITLFRGLAKVFRMRPASILENNIVQTTGSAGESIAFGVAATMPALMILGFDMELSRIMFVSVLGGLLGILMMIPLRRALVESTHGELPFPEGTACAQVLIAGEKGGSSGRTVFLGFFVGLFYKFASAATRLWGEVAEFPIRWLKGATFASEVSPELLGVGYIIGFRSSALMAAGGVLSSFVLIPAIYLFGSLGKEPLFPATQPIALMTEHEIWKCYVLYIGAGAVATAGIVSLVRSLPVIVRAALAGFAQLKASGGKAKNVIRTRQDISMKWVLLGSLGLVVVIATAPALQMNLIGAALIVVFGFLFVTVSSRITGEIGSSSNPVSGMTVATLLLTSLIFLAWGRTSPMDRVAALSVAAIVCIAASNGGTTAQDLKTGHLVGATPRLQQFAILLGSLTSALVIGYTFKYLNSASTIYSQLNLPQGRVSNVEALKESEKVEGPEAATDPAIYRVLRVTESNANGELKGVPYGKYLVDEQGLFRYLVDPGINGVLQKRDDGTSVYKYEAPKARLMSLIIDGILAQKLPWGLVLLGVFLVVMLELCGIPSLTFAVGVYLPLSSSMPIFFGGLVRYLCRRIGASDEGDSGPGVLVSSGLIAGGSIAGISIALLSVQRGWGEALDLGKRIPTLAQSPWLSMMAFGILAVFLFREGVRGSERKK